MTAKKTTIKKSASTTAVANVSSEHKEVPSPAQELQTVTVVDNATKKSKKAPIIKAIFARERVILEHCDAARDLYNTNSYGTLLDDGKVQLSLTEGLYLMEKKKIYIIDGRNKSVDLETYISKASRIEPTFWVRYAVFRDMRNRGYVIKTALKFGADFRVYDRGIKPGQDHARWIVYPVHEGERYTWFDFAAKNRVAHSTKKRLLMGVVDDENDVTYWEIKWVRP
jgi:tRNA-intron endonuclease, archaea type